MGSKLISFINIFSREQDWLALSIKIGIKIITGFQHVLDGCKDFCIRAFVFDTDTVRGRRGEERGKGSCCMQIFSRWFSAACDDQYVRSCLVLVLWPLKTAVHRGCYCCSNGREGLGSQENSRMAPSQCPEKWQTCHS